MLAMNSRPLPVGEEPFSKVGIAVVSHLMSSSRARCLHVWDEKSTTVVLAGQFICCVVWCTACFPGLVTFSSESKSFGLLLVSGEGHWTYE